MSAPACPLPDSHIASTFVKYTIAATSVEQNGISQPWGGSVLIGENDVGRLDRPVDRELRIVPAHGGVVRLRVMRRYGVEHLGVVIQGQKGMAVADRNI